MFIALSSPQPSGRLWLSRYLILASLLGLSCCPCLLSFHLHLNAYAQLFCDLTMTGEIFISQPSGTLLPSRLLLYCSYPDTLPHPYRSRTSIRIKIRRATTRSAMDWYRIVVLALVAVNSITRSRTERCVWVLQYLLGVILLFLVRHLLPGSPIHVQPYAHCLPLALSPGRPLCRSVYR